MMNIVHKLTLKHMRLNKKRTLITIVGVIISVAMISAVSIIIYSLQDAMVRDAISKNGEWHALYTNIKSEDISVIEADENVESLMLSRDIGFARLEKGKNPFKPYLFIKSYNDAGMNGMPIELEEGRMPAKEGEIVLPAHLNSDVDSKYQVGDILSLDMGIRKDQEDNILSQDVTFLEEDESFKKTGESAVYTVVGIIKRPVFEEHWAAGYTAVAYLDSDSLTAGERLNASVLFKDIDRNIYTSMDELGARISSFDDEFPKYNYSVLAFYGKSNNVAFNSMLSTLAGILITIISVGSISLIYNAFAISMSERSRHLGMLSSIGATRKQKRNSVFFESFIVGCISIPVGILSGMGGMAVTFHFINPIFANVWGISQDLRVVINMNIIIITVIVSIITLFVSAYIPAQRAAGLSPIDAIRQSKEIKIKQKEIKTWGIVRKIFGFEGDLALKNLKRYKGRYRATIFSLFISIVLFLTASSYGHYLQKAYGMTRNRGEFDVRVSYGSLEFDEIVEDALMQIGTAEGYTTVDTIGSVFNLTDEKSMELMSTQLEELFESSGNSFYLEDFSFYVDIMKLDEKTMASYLEQIGSNEDELNHSERYPVVVVNKLLTDMGYEYAELSPLNINEGETLPLVYNQYDYDDNGDWSVQATIPAIDLHVAKVTDIVPEVLPYPNSMSRIQVFVTEAVFESMYQELAILIEGQGEMLYSYRDTYIKSSAPDAVVDGLKEILGEDLFYRLSIYNESETNQRDQQMLMLLAVFTYGFIILITLICVANIFNTLYTSINLRKREFAVLKSIGMTPQMFNKMIYFESLFYGIKALLYGLPVSGLIMVWIYRTVNFTFSSGFTLPWTSIIIAIVFVFIVVLSAMIYSASKIKKESIIETIRNEVI